MPALDPKLATLVERAVVASPYARLLGMEFVDAEPDRVRVRLPYRADLVTYGDTVHGGAIAALIDVAATASFWANASVRAGSQGATVGFTVQFLAAARGADLTATASVRRRGRELSSGQVSVEDAGGREVAVALVTYKLSAPG